MDIVLAVLLALVLVALAGLHGFWARGGRWGLAAALGGHAVPPPLVIWAVAAVLAAGAVAVLGRAGVLGDPLPSSLARGGVWAIGGAFALTGLINLAGRTWRERLTFAPACLLLAGLFGVVAA
jgi:hypothetical protein